MKVEDVTPDEVTSTKGWEPFKPTPKRPRWGPEPTEEEKYFKPRGWGEPATEAHKKSVELRSIYEKDRVIDEDGVKWYRTDKKTFEDFRGSFFDSRWFCSVYWDERTKKYESRTPYPKGSAPNPVPWVAPEDWKPETLEEFNERRKHWLSNGI